jgi:electron transport complex protein RnfC
VHPPQPNPVQPLLGRFHGGIRLPDEKAISNGRPVGPAPLPKVLTIPLRQHIGAPARPLVGVGERVLKGQTIAAPNGYVSAAVHASSSGRIIAIENRPIPHPSGLGGPCILIETDGEDAWAGLPEPLPHYEALDPALLRERIRWAGIVGMGGAAFPASVKLSPDPHNPIRTLILNGTECEPYVTCDDRLMRERADAILAGARIILHLLGAEECLIGIEDNKPEAIESLRLAVADSDLKGRTRILAVPSIYPSGGEKQLIRMLTGLEVPSHGIPAQVGVVCHNVATAAAVADAVLEGRPSISRYVTVTGRGVRTPQNLEARVGAAASELIAHCGGYSRPVRRLVLGGPMMGVTLGSDQVPITKAAGCLLALTSEEAPDPGPALACIRCGDCAAVCPVSLLPQQLYWHARAGDLDRVRDYNLFDCIECGCCAHVCPSHIPLVQYYRHAKAESWAREQARRQAEHAHHRYAARLDRLAHEYRRSGARQDTRSPREKPAVPAGNATMDRAAMQAAIAAARQRAAATKATRAGNGRAEPAPKAGTRLREERGQPAGTTYPGSEKPERGAARED